MVIIMKKEEYQNFIKNYTPKPKIIENGLVAFLVGGTLGSFSELLLQLYQLWFHIPRKE